VFGSHVTAVAGLLAVGVLIGGRTVATEVALALAAAGAEGDTLATATTNALAAPGGGTVPESPVDSTAPLAPGVACDSTEDRFESTS
jgi:hypothetical protein